jgi:hypothetical protein
LVYLSIYLFVFACVSFYSVDEIEGNATFGKVFFLAMVSTPSEMIPQAEYAK